MKQNPPTHNRTPQWAPITRRTTAIPRLWALFLLLASLAAWGLTSGSAFAAGPPRSVGCDLKVSDNGRFLVKRSDGKPFYYQGDVAWELVYNLTREEVRRYLDDRAQKKFTVIQTSLVSLYKGAGPNAQEDRPFANGRPLETPGNSPENATAYDFWDHVEYIAAECAKRGMYLSLAATWSNARDAVNNPNPLGYGKFLGARFRHTPNIIWILAGDSGGQDQPKWAELAKGLAMGTTGGEDYSKLLISFHPKAGTTTAEIHNRPWLSFHLVQSGQEVGNYPAKLSLLPTLRPLQPAKPALDCDPNYEGVWGKGAAFDVRRANWWSVFAGAFGHTYGQVCVSQMWKSGRLWDGCGTTWEIGARAVGSSQSHHLQDLVTSRPMLSRIPDQGLLVNDLGVGPARVMATRGDAYAFVYSPMGQPFTVQMGRISGGTIKAWWYNPRNGEARALGTFPNQGKLEFKPPSRGEDQDWALVLDDAAKSFPPPGGKKGP